MDCANPNATKQTQRLAGISTEQMKKDWKRPTEGSPFYSCVALITLLQLHKNIKISLASYPERLY